MSKEVKIIKTEIRKQKVFVDRKLKENEELRDYLILTEVHYDNGSINYEVTTDLITPPKETFTDYSEAVKKFKQWTKKIDYKFTKEIFTLINKIEITDALLAERKDDIDLTWNMNNYLDRLYMRYKVPYPTTVDKLKTKKEWIEFIKELNAENTESKDKENYFKEQYDEIAEENKQLLRKNKVLEAIQYDYRQECKDNDIEIATLKQQVKFLKEWNTDIIKEITRAEKDKEKRG